jgi:hypothetical protein
MRKYHLWVGVLIVVVFLITGQFMRHHDPPMGTLGGSTRLMFRSRHIYLLASGLVNLMIGLYLQRQVEGWRRTIQMVGSGLLVASPALLILAFAVEPEKGFQTEMWWSASGLYALFAGCMGHLVSGIGKPEAKTARPAHSEHHAAKPGGGG